MFDQREFGAGMQLAKVYLIHEGADEEDAAAGAAQDVLGRERVGDGCGVESGALVCDADDEGVGVGLEGGGDVLGGVVGVAVQDGVDGGLADGHGDVGDGVLVEAGACGEVFGGVLDAC